MAYIKFDQSSKIYQSGAQEVRANDQLSFELQAGELTIIVGASGAGKSTLLNILGGMDTNTSGQVWVAGHEISAYSQQELTTYRRLAVGFVFQFYNLIPNLTVQENVELAAHIVPEAFAAPKVLQAVGLKQRAGNFPAELSGGEQQRVAIARAIAKKPALLLCDEPTGALDYHTGKNILQLLQDYCRQAHKNVIIVTHNALIKPMADHILELSDGKIKTDQYNDQPTPVRQLEW